MEEYAPWLTCRIGKKVYLLAKDKKAYYLIEVGKNLDYATEEWLERQGVSEALLKELQLAFTYIPINDLRGVALSGHEAGEYVYLYLKSEKKKLMLELDYEHAWMDAFFAGLSRFSPPVEKKAKKKNVTWRREKRNPEQYKKLAWVPLGIGLAMLAVNIGFFVNRTVLWFTLWLVMLAVPLVLVILMPGYFTLIPVDKGKKQDAWGLDLPMFLHFASMMLMDRRNWIDDSISWVVLGICVVISGLICLLTEEFRRDILAFLGALFFGGIVGLSLAGQANELYPHEQPQSYILEVENTHKSGGKSRSYYCTVVLPDGRKVSLNISRSLYEAVEIGDYVRVEHGVGALGIEYANAYSVE